MSRGGGWQPGNRSTRRRKGEREKIVDCEQSNAYGASCQFEGFTTEIVELTFRKGKLTLFDVAHRPLREVLSL